MSNLSELLKVKNSELKREHQIKTQNVFYAIDMKSLSFKIDSYFTEIISKLNFEVPYLTGEFLIPYLDNTSAYKLIENFSMTYLLSTKIKAYLEDKNLGKFKVDIAKKNDTTFIAVVTLQL